MSLVSRSLGMGRALAEARMTEVFTFYTVTRGEDPVTLQPVDVEHVIAANVKGRLRITSSVWSDKAIAGQEPATMQREVHVPLGTAVVGPSVFVRVVSSTVDPSIVGRVFRTGMRSGGGQVTAARYPVEEVS